jgi:cyclin-A
MLIQDALYAPSDENAVVSNRNKLQVSKPISSAAHAERNALPECDMRTLANEQYVSEYAHVIFQRLWDVSLASSPPGDYLHTLQPHCTVQIRIKLVQWLVQLHSKLALYPETLFRSIDILDRFLSRCPQVPLSDMQLAAASSLLIASKVEDAHKTAEIPSLRHACDLIYTKAQFIEMETLILNCVAFNVSSATVFQYVARLSVILHATELQFNMVMYCSELGLADYSIATSRYPCHIAIAAFVLASRLVPVSRDQGRAAEEKIEAATGHSTLRVKLLSRELADLAQADQHSGQLSQIRVKYSKDKYCKVATLFSL